MNWRRISLWSGCGILLLLLLSLGALLVVDLGVFKPQIEQWVTDKTGRQLLIDGPLEVSLGGQSIVAARGVRLANASWSDEALMLDIGDVEARVNTWSLLTGRIEVDLIRLEDTSIRLERSDDLRPNWDLIPPSPGTAKVTDDKGIDWLVRQIDIERVRVEYVSPDRTGPVDLRIKRLNQRHRDDDYLEMTAVAAIGGRDLSISAEAGTWSALLEQKDVEYEINAQLDTLTIMSKGRIDDLVTPSKPVFSFSATGPDVNDLARLLQVAERGSGGIDLSGSLETDDGGRLILSVDGNLGQIQAEGAGYFSDLQDLEHFDVDLKVSGPDAAEILSLLGIQQFPGVAFELNVDAERRGQMVQVKKAYVSFAEARLDLSARLPDFPTLDDSSMHIEVVGNHFERFREVLDLPGGATGPYSLAFDLSVSQDGVEVLQLDIESSLLKLHADGWLSDAPGYIGSELQIDAELKSLADISAAYDIGSFSNRPLTIAGLARLSEDGIRTRSPMSIRSNDIEATVGGLLALTPGIVGSDLTFMLSGSSLAALVDELVSTDYIPAEAYELGGRVQLRQNDYRFQEIAGTVGRSSVEVDGLLNLAGGMAGTKLRFKSNGPAIEELTRAFDDLNITPGPYSLAATLSLADDVIQFDDIEYSRDRGQISGDLELAFPESGLEADFDLRASGTDLHSVIGTADGFAVADVEFSVDARGEYRGTRVSLDKLNISVGEATVSASGDFDFAETSRSTHFSIGVDIPSLAKLGSLNGRPMRDQGLTIDANVDGARGFLQIDELTAKLGDSDIRGNMRIEKGDVPKLIVDLYSDSLRFAPLLEEQELEYDPTPKFDDGRLIPDVAIPFDRMRQLDAHINIDIGELHRDALHVTDLKMDLEVVDGELTLHDFSVRPIAGLLRAKGSLGPADGSGQARLVAGGEDISFGLSELDTDFRGRSDIEINLESTGKDLRSLAANLDGILFVNSTNIIVPENQVLKRLYGDMLGEIVSTINPFSKSSTNNQLDCVVLPLEITAGALATNPFALILNSNARMIIKSSVNLQTEKLSMQFETTPRKGITISAGEILNPYVKVVGTLAKPTLAVDEQGVLISGGAAVATGGLTILAKAAWQRLSRNQKPCQTAAEQSIEALGERFPRFSPPADSMAH